MTINGDSLRKLAALKLSPDQISAVLELIADMMDRENNAKAKIAERTRRYRERGGGVPEDLRQFIFARDGYECCECGSRDYLQCDHVVPVSKGGKATEDNLQTLCRICNARKKDRVRKSDVRGMSTDILRNSEEYPQTPPPSEEKRKIPLHPLKEKTQPTPQPSASLRDTQSAREIGELFGLEDPSATLPEPEPDATLGKYPSPAEQPQDRFPELWAAYPKRSGNNSRKDAAVKFARIVKSGADPGRIIEGAKRYAVWCDATGKTGTEMVKQTVPWLNSNLWENDYEIPTRQDRNAGSNQYRPENGAYAEPFSRNVRANAIIELRKERLAREQQPAQPESPDPFGSGDPFGPGSRLFDNPPDRRFDRSGGGAGIVLDAPSWRSRPVTG